ncbi:MAG: glucoamylase [Planctomycetota bacterium]|nr:MAG: glucoamylase [Planctomycetota bacterium]
MRGPASGLGAGRRRAARRALRPALAVASAVLAAVGAPWAAGCGGGSGSAVGNPRPGPAAGYQARTSLQALALSNGYAAAAYDLQARALTVLRPHLYAVRRPGEPVPELARRVEFGVRTGAGGQWLSAVPLADWGYLEGTGIAYAVQRAAGLRLETYAFAPMEGARHAVALLVRAVNESGTPLSGGALVLRAELALGGGADASAEWAFQDAGFVMEGRTGTGRRVIYQALGGLDGWAIATAGSADDPQGLVPAGMPLPDRSWPLNADGVVCGLERELAAAAGGALAPGAEAWWGVLIALREDGDEAALRAEAAGFAGGLDPPQLLARERRWWDAFHARERLPRGLGADELRVFRQSTAILKMGQCREPAPWGGQLLASLPPGKWNICWPRDASYAIAALAAAGHLEEAQAGLRFMLEGRAGQYQGWIGRPYRISVARYYGDGTEESDDNGNGPNIELDNFGLVLWALGTYLEQGGDPALLQQHWPAVRDGIAEVLLGLIEPNDLLRADSSIWERHLYPAPGSPDGARQFAYSSICAAHGLEHAARMAARMGEPQLESRWRDAAARLRAGIVRELVMAGEQAIAGSVEERRLGIDYAMDGSAVEAINFEVVPPHSPLATGTLAALDRWLRPWPLRSPGYLRNDDARSYGPDNWYDRQEWVVIDLRVASAFARVGERARAAQLLEWVTAQAVRNAGLIPELYDEHSSAYAGEVPMVGFGAGAWVLAQFDLAGR